MKKRTKIKKIVIFSVLAVLSFIFIYPVLNMILKSLMTTQEVRMLPPRFLPEKPQWINYVVALSYPGYYKGIPYILVYLKNTLIVVFGVTIGGTFSALMCAFGFSKIKFPGRDIIFFGVLATMMLPYAVMMIPLYAIFHKIGWTNSLYPLWVPAWFGGGAVSIFFLRQFMKTFPDEIIESAKIDGASYWTIFLKIIIPYTKPMIIVLIMNYFFSSWNDLMGPLIYTDTQDKWTLALGVTNMGQGALGTIQGLNYVMAACTMMTLIPFLIFLFGQKYFIENITFTGIKG
ncbi:ABC-type transporter, integral membrane subunit [Thermoanaerobacterium xylanolyticum LX-11]|uniref:ABC-type transporter, integral membrane subunit n=1 Tax=Thermoanaerobacterium xylanolyticum (strain ATCC 49914 / DSM 7097 / LX-11) TaxID=858215 RepID=F6BKE2_THEXL|nr:carbohydrate ABC transporter permease [Thermoanaerobacterium xylanolyticum]AEF18089.1 ABC-type transporter, integral membrane subunit [Thermoanaerobacterium xylanolyticum LX-11]